VLKYPVDMTASFGTISLLTLYIGYLLLRFHRDSGGHYLIVYITYSVWNRATK
jgi:hypothetical protein